MNRARYKCSIIPAVQEMLMRRPILSRIRQGELFSPPVKLPELPVEVRQKMARLLSRMLKEYLLQRPSVTKQGVSGE